MKALLVKVGRGVLAGLTSTEAVKSEKNVAAIVITRVVIAIGGSAVTADLLVKLILGA